MAFSAKFGIWIVQGNGKEFKIYVNPNDTIYKIKNQVTKRTKTEEKRFCLFKSDNTELEDDKTVKDCNIRAGDKLKKEDKKPYKRTRSDIKPDSAAPLPYVRPVGVIPLLRPSIIIKNCRHQMRKANYGASFDTKDPKGSTSDIGQQNKPPQDKTVLLKYYIAKPQIKESSQAQTDLPIKKVIPTEQKQKPDNIAGNEKSENNFPRDIKTAPLPAKVDYCEQSEFEKQLRRPRTAYAVTQFIFLQSKRPLSTLNMRTSSMDDLTKLDTELICNEQLQKASKLADSKRNNETRKYTEAIRPFYGDLVEAITDPVLVSSRLYQEGLITFTDHRNTSTLGWTDSSKANKLLKHVNIQLMTSQRPLEVLKSFCKVIRADPILSEFIPKIEKHISCEILSRQPSPIRDVRVISAGNFKKCRGECLVSQDDIPNLLYRTAVVCQQKWYIMGSLLGLSTEELNHIGKIHSNSPGNCYADMISRYVCSKQLRPTWHLITKYLMQPLEQYDLGMLFRKEYCKDCCYTIED